jgi:hypothetical protein
MSTIHPNLALFTKDTKINKVLGRPMEHKCGLMAANMKESGLMGKLVVKGVFGTRTVINMKDSGKTIRQTATDCICTQMVPSI